ncbi:unnamed protein product [Alternaria alternata]
MNFPGRDTPPRPDAGPTTERAGGMFTEPAPAAIMNNRYAKVPTIIGFTSNGRVNTKSRRPPTMKGEFSVPQRPLPAPHRRRPEHARQATSATFALTYLASNAMSEHNPENVPTYQYQWDVMWGVDIENGYGTEACGTVGQVMVRRQNEISDYFISFIKFLDPNREHQVIPRKDVKIAKWEPLDNTGRRMFFTNIKEGGHRGDGTNMLGKMRTEMRSRDNEREKNCGVIRGMFRRLQFEGVPALKLD